MILSSIVCSIVKKIIRLDKIRKIGSLRILLIMHKQEMPTSWISIKIIEIVIAQLMHNSGTELLQKMGDYIGLCPSARGLGRGSFKLL